MIEVNGHAHVILTVSQFEAARAFYCELLPFLGMKKVYDGNNFVYHVGGRTALGIQRCAEEYEGERFVQNRIGLHHLCLRARAREDVDKVAEKLRAMGAFIDRGPICLPVPTLCLVSRRCARCAAAAAVNIKCFRACWHCVEL